jgi:DNA-binding NarL/FixJ family response regulator
MTEINRGSGAAGAAKVAVLVIEDDARVRRAVRSLIDSASDLLFVGEASSEVEALELDQRIVPDVVLLDILLPLASDGMRVLGRLLERGRRVVAMSIRGGLAADTVAAGAHVFVEKDVRGGSAILVAIRAAADRPVGSIEA